MPITPEQQQDILALTVTMFNATPGADNLNDFADNLEFHDGNMSGLAADLAATGVFQEQYAGRSTQDEVIETALGILSIPPDSDGYALAEEHFQGRFAEGWSLSDILVEASEYLFRGTDIDPSLADVAATLQNKVTVSNYFSDVKQMTAPTLEPLQAIVADVDETSTSVDDAIMAIDAMNPPEPGDSRVFTLTQQADYFAPDAEDPAHRTTDEDTEFRAPVTQNETGSGQLANTFETGDVLNGGANSLNELRADLIATGTVSDPSSFPGAAISATTDNIQNVFLRAQTPQQDTADNTTWSATVDAEKMTGVQQWWSDNSRSNIRIEDIRTTPMSTDFGMQSTDPAVSYEAYFNPLFMEGLDNDSTLSVWVQQVDENGNLIPGIELENISVREINFDLNGESFSLATEAMEEADTWEALETALNGDPEDPDNAGALADAGLDNLTATHQGNGRFIINDPDGGTFEIEPDEALIFGAASDIDVRNRVGVGAPEEGPTETDLILDGAGNGSQGGDVNLAAMSGDRGIEVINVDVDRDSHIASLSSVNSPNTRSIFDPVSGWWERSFDAETQLEEVFVDHRADGAQGNLQIGTRTQTPLGESTFVDDRLNTDGLTNVREFNAIGFASEIKLGATLDQGIFNKYLDPAEDTVQFSYLFGDGGTNLNLDVDGQVSRDVDFALDIVGGLGDDRFNLTGSMAVKDTIKIDGGEGSNTVSVRSTTADNVSSGSDFDEFVNIQTLVVEGDNNTVQDTISGNMGGLEQIIVATNAPVDTTLSNVDSETDVIVNGKNHTLGGGNSDNAQRFGEIAINNSPGTEQAIELYNTARFEGQLVVDTLSVDRNDSDTDPSSNVDTLIIDSQARIDREQSNAVTELHAGSARNVELIGDKDLGVNVVDLATKPINPNIEKPLTVDGSELDANLTLGFNAALNQESNNDELTGTDGEGDTLALWGAMGAGTFNATVSDFEHVQFGYHQDLAVSDKLGGDISRGISGRYDAGNDAGVGSYQIANSDAAVTLDNLGSTIDVIFGEAGGDDESQTLAGPITLNGSDDQTDINLKVLSPIALANGLPQLEINEYSTINVDVQRSGSPSERLVLNLDLDPIARDDDEVDFDASALNVDAQIGVDLWGPGVQFVDGMDITTGSGDDRISMASATSLTVDAGAGKDVFIYDTSTDSARDARDTILGFEARQDGQVVDKIDIRTLMANEDFEQFAYLGDVDGVDGDLNGEFKDRREDWLDDNPGVDAGSVLFGIYDVSTRGGVMYFDTNRNGAVGELDAEEASQQDITSDLAIRMPGIARDVLTDENFMADSIDPPEPPQPPVVEGVQIDEAITYEAVDGIVDTFIIDISGSPADEVFGPGFDGAAEITGFNSAEDTLIFNDVGNSGISIGDILAANGFNVNQNVFENQLDYLFNIDPDGNEATIEVSGVGAQSADFIEVA